MPADWNLPPERFFGPESRQKATAMRLYQGIADLPLVCPHGHVDPAWFARGDAGFGDPAAFFVTGDHYILRMLHSQGIALEKLGIPPLDGSGEVERDPRRIWQRFAENFYLFRATPVGAWLSYELVQVFGVHRRLDAHSAQAVYDQVAEKLAAPEFQPRRLFEQFKIEALCTSDPASQPLDAHEAIRASGWGGRVLPTFRPDDVLDLTAPDWRGSITRLGGLTGVDIRNYGAYIEALRERRAQFRALGAVASDHAVEEPYTGWMERSVVAEVFQRALRGEVNPADAVRFGGHMLMEMAAMSAEDGLVMQLHAGALRNHNHPLWVRFGANLGADIPLRAEFTCNLRPLLEAFGEHPNFTLILFTLDESAYARELAPLAGHYPAVRLGPPWWFHDSLGGIGRYFDQVVETAGLYNLAGFNDDTRAFASIPARHDLWRRASANWLAGQVATGVLELDEAEEMAVALAVGLAKTAYRLG
ncbi:MAG: glucuronate isomerase [Anaerolineae bacterium]|nr:glucuronate isomerase [Anaerolineae bacterium]